jgi:hypothetical protein
MMAISSVTKTERCAMVTASKRLTSILVALCKRILLHFLFKYLATSVTFVGPFDQPSHAIGRISLSSSPTLYPFSPFIHDNAEHLQQQQQKCTVRKRFWRRIDENRFHNASKGTNERTDAESSRHNGPEGLTRPSDGLTALQSVEEDAV